MSGTAFDVSSSSQFIRAGAGAGKTTRLIKTFLQFAKDFRRKNSRLPRVVMTTFTRKATQEVKERLLVSALTENEKEIFEYINQKSYVHISTIHGLLSVFLGQYAELLQFPLEIKIIEGPQHLRRLKRQINEIFKRRPEYLDLLEHYSFNEITELSKKALEYKAQFADLSYINESELTQIAQQRRQEIIYLIEDIFAKSGEVSKSWQSFFEFLNGVKNALQNDNIELFLQLLDDMPNKPQWKEAKPSLDPVAHEAVLLLKDDYFTELFDLADDIKKHEALNSLYLNFVDELHTLIFEHKRLTGELTIADLENLSLQLVEKFPEAAKEFSDSWDYFMVDEYQDTSPLQVRILNELIRDKPCFIVGDPQQSIYLFRGARSEVFNEKQSEMIAAGAQIELLDKNYRSEPSLMHYINGFFAGFSTQFKPMLTKTDFLPDKKLAHDAFYIKTENQAGGTLKHIAYLLAQGAKPQDICVLSRNNKSLEDIAVKARQSGINVQLQAASGFEEKREILDLISFNKFLNNPHDDENLIALLRSPWFFIEDSQLLELSRFRREAKCSYWSALIASSCAQKNKLISYLNLFDAAGCSVSTQYFMAENSFLSLSLYYDNTGKREANIFKYLMTLAEAEKNSGFSLGLFLDEQFQSLQIESGGGNAEAQPVVQPDCVSLMTVHASKGLQYKHVIVLGFADPMKTSSTADLSFSPEIKKLSLAVLSEEAGKHKPSYWAKTLRWQLNEREILESERVLYVAMTRAVESLSLVVDTGKRTNKNSWLAKMQWPATNEIVGETYKIISLTYDNSEVSRQTESDISVKARPMYSPEQSNETQTQSVTELLSVTVASDTVDYARQLNNLKKAQFGSDLHRIFESLKYLDVDQLKLKLRTAESEAVHYLLTQVELDLKSIIKRGQNEWGFGLKTKSNFLQGQIDLWAELENEIHVVDYKTGSSDYSAKAFEQLSFYTMALLQMKLISENKKIVHSVIYPIEKTVKTKAYANRNEFVGQLNPKIKELF